MTPQLALRTALTLALAFAAASLCLWLRLPLPWMLGPLVSVAIVSMLGAQTQSLAPLRNTGQLVIGTALGLYFTPQIMALLATVWWAIVLGILWALALGWLFGLWLHRGLSARMPGTEREKRATSYFAGGIGGASEMTLLAEREGGRTDLVASAHSLRILTVTVLIPFAFTWLDLHGADTGFPGPRHLDLAGLAMLLGAAGVGAWLLERSGRANPWFMGALVVSMVLTMAGLELSAIPGWMSNGAQLVIGVSLGVRFRAEFVHTAPRWLAWVLAGTVAMVVVSAVFGWLLSLGMGMHPATLILGTSPGGIAEMAITAKVLQLGVPVVTAFQVCRLLAVLVLVEPLYRRLYLR
jgi:membrane AbrB-like protein